MFFPSPEIKISFIVAFEVFQHIWANSFMLHLFVLLEVLFSVMSGKVKAFDGPFKILGLDNK